MSEPPAEARAKTRGATPPASPGLDAWGRRLSDAVRAALAAGEFATALDLARRGDGQTRSLAKEYTFMVRGLGITLRVLLRLLQERAAGATAARREAQGDLRRLLARFRNDLGEPVTASPEAAEPSLEREIECTAQTIDAAATRFDNDQARRAAEVVRALESADAATALALIDAKEREYLPYHDRLIRFMAESFAWVLGHYGADELLRFHLATAEGQRAGFEKWETMPPEEFARTTAFLLKQHMGQVAVSEDDEKYTIEQRPCGSGGRLQLAGAYEGAEALPFVERRGPLTFGEARMPVYCSHCAIWNGTATLKWFGRAQWVFGDPARADGGCRLHIYKRRDDTPAEYVRRVGQRSEG